MAPKVERKQASPVAKAYLIAYNAVQAVGWGVCLAQVAREMLKSGDAAAAYRAAAPAAGTNAPSRALCAARGARPRLRCFWFEIVPLCVHP